MPNKTFESSSDPYILTTAFSFFLAVFLTFTLDSLALQNQATYFAIKLPSITLLSLIAFLVGIVIAYFIPKLLTKRFLQFSLPVMIFLLIGYYLGDQVFWTLSGMLIGLLSGIDLLIFGKLFHTSMLFEKSNSSLLIIIITSLAYLSLNWSNNKVFRYLGPSFAIIYLAMATILVWLLPKPEEFATKKDHEYLFSFILSLSIFPALFTQTFFTVQFSALGNKTAWFWLVPLLGTTVLLYFYHSDNKVPCLFIGLFFNFIALLSLPLFNNYYLSQSLLMIGFACLFNFYGELLGQRLLNYHPFSFYLLLFSLALVLIIAQLFKYYFNFYLLAGLTLVICGVEYFLITKYRSES